RDEWRILDGLTMPFVLVPGTVIQWQAGHFELFSLRPDPDDPRRTRCRSSPPAGWRRANCGRGTGPGCARRSRPRTSPSPSRSNATSTPDRPRRSTSAPTSTCWSSISGPSTASSERPRRRPPTRPGATDRAVRSAGRSVAGPQTVDQPRPGDDGPGDLEDGEAEVTVAAGHDGQDPDAQRVERQV